MNKYGNITYYGSSKTFNGIVQKVQKQCFDHLNLQSKVLHEAIIYPAGNFNNMFTGGIYTKDCNFISAHQHYYDIENREHWGNFIPQENFCRDLDKENYKAGNILYGGFIWSHFGHFITESLSRLYHYFFCNNYDEVIFLLHPNLNIQNLPEYITKVLNLLDMKYSFITEPCVIENLTIPDQSFHFREGPFSYDDYILPYKYILDKVNLNSKDLLSYEKIYLSRSEFVKNDIYEKSLLDFFSNRGYVIISPEQYSIEQQIYFINKAKHIVTTFGSISHLLLFADISSHQTILIRNPEKRWEWILEPQIKISLATRSSNINFVDAGTKIFPYLNQGTGPFLLFANENIEQCFSSIFRENQTTIVNNEKQLSYKMEGLFFYFSKYVEHLSSLPNKVANIIMDNPEATLLYLLKNLDYYFNNNIDNFRKFMLKGYYNSKFVGQDCCYYFYKLEDNAENRKLIMNFETLSTNVQPSFCRKINLSKDGKIVDLENKQNSYPEIYWAIYKDSLCFFDEEMNFLRKFQENETLPLSNCVYSGGYIYIYILEGLQTKLLTKPKTITREDFLLKLQEKQNIAPALCLDLHLSTIGWINALVAHKSTNNPTVNTIEALRISSSKSNFSFEYCTEYDGSWGKKVKAGEISGTTGKSTPITGFALYLAAETAENYEIFYKIADKNGNWSNWTHDGEKVSINAPVVDISFKVITKSNISNNHQNIVGNNERISPYDSSMQSTERTVNELLWGQIFNNTISNSNWLKNTAFSAGRWAVGYPYLYAMYRVLNEIKPKNILELGLGQSTRMIGQYAGYHNDVSHFVVEHDEEWINFFQRDFTLSEHSKIIKLNYTMKAYKEASAVRVYEGFLEQFKNQKFDFISIDAPLGGDMKEYARIDVLELIPNNLAENFIIMIDDANRIAETRTIKEIIEKLNKHQIAHFIGRYSGKKDCVVIASNSLKFVCSM